jgi:hypothetical protein
MWLHNRYAKVRLEADRRYFPASRRAGGRQAMPRAEPALPQVATLHLPAVVGAATLRGRDSPSPPSGYPWESFGADLALRHAHCHDALRTHGPKGKSGGAAGDCCPNQNRLALPPKGRREQGTSLHVI